MVTARGNARQDIAHLGLVVDQLQQRLTVRALLADTKDVFGGRVQRNDQKMFIKKDDANTQRVENVTGVSVQRSVVAGPGRALLVRLV